MRKIPLIIPFSLAILGLFLGSFIKLNFFAPFLAMVYYVSPFSKALWISVGCGYLLDLISSEFRFGIYSLTWVLTTLVLFSQKKHFFEDKPVAFSIFTGVISAVSTALQIVLIHLFDRGIPFSILDVIVMPIIDGMYAFLWFTCPLRLYTYIKKIGWRNVFRKTAHEE